MIDKASMIPAQDHGVIHLADETKPTRVLANQFWQRLKLFWGEGMIKPRKKSPDRCPPRSVIHGV